jgi:hypothetical protein
MKLMKNINISNLLLSILIGFVSSFLIAGFVAGFLTSYAGNGLGDMKNNLFWGFAMSFLSLITVGNPWGSETETQTVYLKLLIVALFIQITFMVYQNFKRKLSKNPKT